MKILFADDTQLEVIAVRGGQQYLQNAMRDVLTIETDPANASVATLRELFSDKEKTAFLRTVTEAEIPNDETDETETREIVSEIGEGYTLYLSASNEVREQPVTPGQIVPPQTVEINTVRVAQITYLEKLLEQALGAR